MENSHRFNTVSDIQVKAVYSPDDIESLGFSYATDLGHPGKFPYTRGIHPEMYRDTLWIMGQYSGYGSAEDSNKRYRHLIEQGATGLSIALDLPTQIGLDSDHELSRGEIGRAGVAIDSLEDMELLFEGVSLSQLRQLRTTANAIGPIFLALYLALAEKQNISPRQFHGYFQNDPLKEFVSRGTYIFPPAPSVKLAVDVIEYCANYLPEWTPINFCGYHMRDAGGTAVQELAFTLANAVAYIENALERGLHIDQFAQNLTFFLAGGMDFFEEIAKFRSARKLWANILSDRFGAKKPASLKLPIFCYTAGSNLTAQQPLNNISRVTIAALAAVLGGVQTLATSSYDEALATPSTDAATVALRTQQIIAYESGAINTVDPLAGSYFIEKLTTELEKEVLHYIERIDGWGGAIRSIENRKFQSCIEESAYKYQKEINNNERILVGVNQFQTQESTKIELIKVDPKVEEKQRRRLQQLKKNRSNNDVKKALERLKSDAENELNTVPACLQAVKAYATVGEMVAVLKSIYGEYGHSS